ncbi:MAG: energy transducer TonB [Bacteroidales bacterium]|nr:energy transducer TonB [Bacteroidales bacterium]
MKQIIITMLLLLAALTLNAQDKGKTPQDAEKGEQKYEVFDDYFEPTPQFPGGDKAYVDYIKKNMRYPEEAKKKGIEGRVFVQCVIEKDGSHNSYKVIKSADSLLNEEAIRIVKGMPKWIPGNDWGETKRVRYTMPITFKLEKEQVKK